MRIALACPYAWDAPGGVQVHVGELARHLRDRGHGVLVLTPSRTPVADPAVVVVGRPLRVRYQGTVAPIAPWPWSAAPVAAGLRRFRPDVLHAHEPLVPSTAMAATLVSRAPVVATFHAHAERSRLLDLAAPLLRPVWDRLAVRVAVSEAAARFVSSRFRDGLRIVPNGVDVEAFSGAAPEPGLPPGRRILWVGRLDPQKGFPILAESFCRVADRFPDVRLAVVGEGRDRDALRTLPPAVAARVETFGTVPHARLPALHAASEVFVSPATGQESFGMVLVEAMAAGLPVVASDIPGYREVVSDGVEALLVPPRDAGRLAEALSRVLADASLRRRLGEAGRRRAERYRWERVVDDLEGCYREAVGLA